MENCSSSPGQSDAILAFDTLYTTNHLQMLKLLLPHLEIEHQQQLAVFIKWQEFRYTLRFTSHKHSSKGKCLFGCQKQADPEELFPILLPYCNEEEKKVLSTFANLSSTMKTWQDLSQYLPLIQEMAGNLSGIFPQGAGSDSPDNGDQMMNLIKTMMNPEQQSMFSMFMGGENL